MSDPLERFKKSDKIPKQCICANKKPDLVKNWGSEEWVYQAPEEYAQQEMYIETVKLLNFLQGQRLSLHQHLEKKELFFCLSGKFFIDILDLSTQMHHSFYLNAGERIFIPRGLFHRMLCEETGSILEVSTLDKPSDSYRLIKGD